MQRNILYIAYHFPPIAESSGVLRTLSFINALREHGYNVTVLTVSENALKRTSESNRELIPAGLNVARGRAWDWGALSITGGRYPGWLACPDRYSNWIVSGFLKGRSLIRQLKPCAIVSTSPMATAHLLGFLLSRHTQTPWVTDFRDPLAQIDYPVHSLQRKVHWWLERKASELALMRVFATESARVSHQSFFPASQNNNNLVLENGYDERLFANNESSYRFDPKGPWKLYHSGALSQEDRDPASFIKALAKFRDSEYWPANNIEVVFRCSEPLSWLTPTIAEYKLEDVVSILPVVEYKKALEEFVGAAALLLFQGASCEQQIPAKAYEYIRSKRPVLTLSCAQGATSELMNNIKLGPVVDIDDSQAIESALVELTQQIGSWHTPLSDKQINSYSRQEKAQRFADELNKRVGV